MTMTMASEELVQQRSEFYDSYVSGNTSVTILSPAGLHNSDFAPSLSSPNKTPPSNGIQPLLARSSLMHAVRSCGLCPTEKELEAAELDALEPNGKFVTKDQFLEICDQLKSLSTDVQHQEVLEAFKAVIIDERKSLSGSSKGQLLPPPSTDELCKSLSGSTDKKEKKHERFVFTHKEMRIILPELNDEQFKIAMHWLDPQNTNQVDVRKVSELLSGGVDKKPILNGVGERNVGGSNRNSPKLPQQESAEERQRAQGSPKSPPPSKAAAPPVVAKGDEKKASGGCCVIQ